MFGRKPAAAAPVTPPASRTSGYAQVVGLEALPDRASIGRMDALRAFQSRSLNGQAGTAVGYDRGDPGMTLQHSLKGRPSPVSDAMAASFAKQPTPANSAYPDSLTTNPALDPYNSLLWSRMVNQS